MNANKKTYSHRELTWIARRWLHSRFRCSMVLCEPAFLILTERPDAIGWDVKAVSYVVEVKTSLSDYYSDQQKPGRRNPCLGMGQVRYYLTPKGLIKPGLIKNNWGLAETDGSRVRIVKKARRVDVTECHSRQERVLLLKHLDRSNIETRQRWWHAETQGLGGEGI